MNKHDGQKGQENEEEKWKVGRPGVFNSVLVAALVAILFGYAVFFGLQTYLAVKILILIAIWWLLLLVFWVLPIFSYFDSEKNWISRYKASAATDTRKAIVSVGFYFLYWPIFVPKEVIFWCLSAIVVIYYLINFLGG